MSRHHLEPLRARDLELVGAAGSIDPLESEGELNVSEYLAMIRHHWRLILFSGVVGGLIGAVLYSTTPRIYEARARIQIERRALSPLSSQGTNWLEAWWNPEYYPTQFEILKSRGLAEQVVLDLRLWEDANFNPSIATASATEAESVGAARDAAALGAMANRLLGGLIVRPKPNTQLVDILYRSQSPELAMRIANGVAETFLQRGIKDRSSAASRASTFLSDQIEQVKQEIEAKESRIQAYSREADIVALTEDSNVTLKRLEAINQDYIEARSDRIQKEVRYNELRATPVEIIADSMESDSIGALRAEKMSLEREYATKLKIYKPQWPEMQELKGKIDERRRGLQRLIENTASQARETARSEYQTAQRSETRLEQELDALKNETMQLNSAAIQFNNLKVEISTRRDLLDELVRRQSETSVAVRGSTEPNVHIIEKALLPGRPSEPNLQKKVAGYVALGFFLGIGLVFVVEFMDRSIKTPEELQKRLALPVLAVIPDISADRKGYFARYGGQQDPTGPRRSRFAKSTAVSVDLVPQHRPRLAISESYRSLRTALLLASAEELRVIVVTSATSGEGKTVTAANLATVMAQLGRRVLLIDADLRKPRTHQVFRVSNRVGVVNYLVGRAELEDILVRNGVPNLAVAPSGPIPPNASELLASQRMRELIAKARSLFDFVIIDTPPTLAVTDSTLMGDMSDGVVLCVRAGAIPREDARTCADRLRMSGVKILGTVLNCYHPFQSRYGKSYHHYYYQAYAEDGGDDSAGSVAS